MEASETSNVPSSLHVLGQYWSPSPPNPPQIPSSKVRFEDYSAKESETKYWDLRMLAIIAA
jgi:hypothetical protein